MGRSRKSLLAVAGRLFSCALFGFGLYALKWSPVLVLWGFWMEEVLQLSSAGLKSAILSRRFPGKGYSGAFAGAPLLAFPLAHLVFVIVFSFMSRFGQDPRGPSRALSLLLEGAWLRPGLKDILPLLEVLAALSFWTLVDFLSLILPPRKKPTQAELDKEAKAALVLPHFTIILGGFCLMALKLGHWLAAALVASKCVVELALLPAMEREAEGARAQRGRA